MPRELQGAILQKGMMGEMLEVLPFDAMIEEVNEVTGLLPMPKGAMFSSLSAGLCDNTNNDPYLVEDLDEVIETFVPVFQSVKYGTSHLKFDLRLATGIKSVEVDQDEELGSLIRYLVSFDAGQTLLSYTDHIWKEVSIEQTIGIKAIAKYEFNAGDDSLYAIDNPVAIIDGYLSIATESKEILYDSIDKVTVPDTIEVANGIKPKNEYVIDKTPVGTLSTGESIYAFPLSKTRFKSISHIIYSV